MGQAIPNCTNMCTRAEKRGEYEVDDAETRSRKYKQRKNDVLEKAKNPKVKSGGKESDFLSGGVSSGNSQKEKEKNVRKAIRMFRQENQAIRIQRAYWRYMKNKGKKLKQGKKIEDRYGEKDRQKYPESKMRLIDSENIESLYEKKEDFTFSEKKPVYSIREKADLINMDDVQIDSSTKEDQLRGDLVSLNTQGRTYIDNSDKKARTDGRFASVAESYKSLGPKKHSANSYSKSSPFKSPNKGYSMKLEKNPDSGIYKLHQSVLEETYNSKFI